MSNLLRQNKSEHFKVSGLTAECLQNLRKCDQPGRKTHLLDFMSEFIHDQEQIKYKEADELCCYDRMKKLLMCKEDTKAQKQQKEKVLQKAVQIEAKMNLMEKQMKEEVQSNPNASNPKVGRRNFAMQRKTVSSQKKINHNMGVCPPRRQITHYQSKHQSQFRQSTTTTPNNRNTRNTNTDTIISQLKQKSYEKFFKMQKLQKQTDLNKIKAAIGQEVQARFYKAIEQKDYAKRRIADQNRVLERTLLQKNLELETVRGQNTHLSLRIKQLQQRLYGVNSDVQKKHLLVQYQKWVSQYKECFGDMTVQALNRYVQQIKDKCLDKFDRLQNKNCQKLEEMTKMFNAQVENQKKEVQKLQTRQTELLQKNKNLRMKKQISELQMNELIQSKQQLKGLQNLIISLYSKWYQKRTQNEKQLLKKFNKLGQDYSYADMLKYAVFHEQNISTNDQLNAYILKILRGIQKIRRMIFPMQSNDRLQPFQVLDKIQAWTGARIRQLDVKNRQKHRQIGVRKNTFSMQNSHQYNNQGECSTTTTNAHQQNHDRQLQKHEFQYLKQLDEGEQDKENTTNQENSKKSKQNGKQTNYWVKNSRKAGKKTTLKQQQIKVQKQNKKKLLLSPKESKQSLMSATIY